MKLKREIIKTADGSSTIFLPGWNEHYHSKHGALQEAYHVFIRSGLEFYTGAGNLTGDISILEIGFGTGLNALITLLEQDDLPVDIEYTGIEAYPVSEEELEQLNYSQLFPGPQVSDVFKRLHDMPWESRSEVVPGFSLTKRKMFFHEIAEEDHYDLVYFDAFGPRVQPDLWTEEIFGKMYRSMKKEGVLVTYSAKGSVRRAMQAVGFLVERLPGPPGKREMLRAVKNIALTSGC